jgi:ABC-type sugar transport system ATPase subunit
MTVWRGRAEGGVLVVGSLRIPLAQGLPAGGDLWVGVRPEDVEVADTSLPGGWEGTVEIAEPMGDRTLVTIAVGGERVRALGPSLPATGSVRLRLPPERLHWFDGATEARIEPPR